MLVFGVSLYDSVAFYLSISLYVFVSYSRIDGFMV